MEKKEKINVLLKQLSELINEATAPIEIKQHFKDGDIVEFKGSQMIIKITDIENTKGYGLNGNGRWVIFDDVNFYHSDWQLSTPEKWLEVCKNEAVKRGLVEGTKVKSPYGRVSTLHVSNMKTEFNVHGFFHLYDYLMKDGIWAEVIKADKTLEELDKNYWSDSDLTYFDYIKSNPEAYIKAIEQFLKK